MTTWVIFNLFCYCSSMRETAAKISILGQFAGTSIVPSVQTRFIGNQSCLDAELSFICILIPVFGLLLGICFPVSGCPFYGVMDRSGLYVCFTHYVLCVCKLGLLGTWGLHRGIIRHYFPAWGQIQQLQNTILRKFR